jgi:O-antigen ligase
LLKKLHNYSIFQISYLFLFIALPFIYSEDLIDPALVPRQFLLSLFLIFIFCALFFTGQYKVMSPATSKLSYAFIALNGTLVILSFISICYSNTISESIYVSSKYAIIFIFLMTTYFLLHVQLISKEDLINGVLVFCLISLMYGIYDCILLLINDINILSNSKLISATYANKNLFASALLLSFWAIVAKKMKSVLRFSLLMTLAIFVLLTQSKIVVVIFLLIFAILIIRYLKLSSLRTKLIIALVFIIAFILFFFNLGSFRYLSNLHTLDTRLELWRNSVQMFGEHPFGVGAGNWQIFFPKYGLSHFDVDGVRNGSILYHQPHNDLIWMFCELGIIGGVIYLFLFIIPILMLARAIRKEYNSLLFLLLLVMVGYLGVSFFDFPLERIEHQILIAVVISIVLYHYDSISEKQRNLKLLKFSPVFLVLICLSVTVCYYRIKGEYLTREFILLDKAEEAEFVIENCNKSETAFYTIDPISMPIGWHAGISLFSQNKIEEARQRLEKAKTFTPYNIRVLYHLGNIYEKQGNEVKAEEYYRQVKEISPDAQISTLK